jgi:Uma2 family endonuclease
VNARAFSKIDKTAFFRFMQVQREGRYELDRGYIVPQMTGGTFRHGRIAGRLVQLIAQRCDGTHWIVSQDRGIDTPQTVRYPDVVVEPVGAMPESLATTTPVLMVEVLLPSTTSIDLNAKPTEYLELTPLTADIVASQDQPARLVWLRGTDGLFPVQATEYGLGARIAVDRLGLSIRIDDNYRGIIETPPLDQLSTQDTVPHG